MVHRPPDPSKVVATPDTYCTAFGSMRINWKSPKSTLKMEEIIKSSP